MSSVELEDDTINGSVIGKTNSDVSNEQIEAENKPKLNLQQKLIEWAVEHPRTTKEELYIHVSSSGTAQVIITGLIREGIFMEHKFDCNSCIYFEVDKTKVHE